VVENGRSIELFLHSAKTENNRYPLAYGKGSRLRVARRIQFSICSALALLGSGCSQRQSAKIVAVTQISTENHDFLVTVKGADGMLATKTYKSLTADFSNPLTAPCHVGDAATLTTSAFVVTTVQAPCDQSVVE
jgi:hypothetical protein